MISRLSYKNFCIQDFPKNCMFMVSPSILLYYASRLHVGFSRTKKIFLCVVTLSELLPYKANRYGSYEKLTASYCRDNIHSFIHLLCALSILTR